MAREKRIGKRSALLALIGCILLILPWVLPPLAQPQGYHGFADRRAWLGIPNFGDVASNAAFLLAALLGLLAVYRTSHEKMAAAPRRAYAATFLGLVLTAFGSAYYHWAPSDARLVWDRLPMTLVFMPLLAATLAERLCWRWQFPLPALAVIGVASVLYWKFSGNILPYFVAEFGSILLILLTVLLFSSPWSGRGLIFAVMASYALAFLCERGDKLIFQWTGGVISGHTCKHLAAALAFCLLARMLRRQQRLPDPVPLSVA